MKIKKLNPLVLVTLLFAAVTAGILLSDTYLRQPISIPAGAAAPESTVFTIPPPYPDKAEEGRININTATAQQLQTLPGIGPTTAQRILDYRQEHGPFSHIGELTRVEGIGNARLEALLDLITVGG